MTTELIPLGTNGYFTSHGRLSSSYLVLRGKEAILLDAGTGAARLAEPAIQERLAACETLHLVLSHYHLDHTMGLYYLLGSWFGRPLVIHGPGQPHIDTDPEAAIMRFLSPPFVTVGPEFFERISIQPITGESLDIGSFHLKFWLQDHLGNSLGMRIDDLLVYATDKAMQLEHATHAQGVPLLLHEVWVTEAEVEAGSNQTGFHCSVSQVAEFAKAAGVQKLAPIHHHPSRSDEDLVVIAKDLQQLSGVETIILQESQSYPLD